MDSAVLLADEPMMNLDSHTGAEVLRVLCKATRERVLAVVMVTHDLKIAEVRVRIVRLADGHMVGDKRWCTSRWPEPRN
jgi:putative ABC transport system ATP-binding protein